MADLDADLFNLAMSVEAQPLMDAVNKHIAENVDPITEEFYALDKEKEDLASKTTRAPGRCQGQSQRERPLELFSSGIGVRRRFDESRLCLHCRRAWQITIGIRDLELFGTRHRQHGGPGTCWYT